MSPARRMRSVALNALALVIAAAASLGLAGCTGIPTSSGVNQGIALDETTAIEVDIIARGPADGDSPEQVVTGFLDAAASPQGDYRVARQYLTEEFAIEWDPDQLTTVDETGTRAVMPADTPVAEEPGLQNPDIVTTNVQVNIRPVATVDASGIYEASATRELASLQMVLQQVEGEWRIASAPPGVIVDETTFAIIYRSHSLFFYSPGFEFLVPDVRWFARRESTQTLIVRTLLQGARSYLAPGVVTAIPAGATLVADSVPVITGVASVGLMTDATLDAVAMARLHTQLQASLQTVTGITSVALVINGEQQTITALSPVPRSTVPVDSRPVVLTEDAFGYLGSTSDRIDPIPNLEALVDVNATAITLGRAGQFAAALTPSGIVRAENDRVRYIWSGTGWLAPAVDASGRIWAASDASTLYWNVGSVGSVPARSGQISTGWTGRLVGFAFSRDGTRVAALLENAGMVRTVVSAVQIDPAGLPVQLGEGLTVLERTGTGGSLAWLDSGRLNVLVTGDSTLTQVTIGGIAVTQDAPPSAVSIVTGNVERDLKAVTADGDMLMRSGGSWQVRIDGVRAVATQTGSR